MPPPDAIRVAHDHLLAHRFDAALLAAAPIRSSAAGALLYALALAGSGEAEAAAPLLAAIAAAHPGSRHPVLDLVALIPPEEAARHLRLAAGSRPGDATLHSALGTALTETGPMTEAIEALRRAAELRPSEASAWSNLGKALTAEARFGEAEAALDTAHRLAPGDARIGHNRAICLLKAGRWEAGWAALQARHALPGRPPPLPGPRLRDLDVRGLTVLLRHEEGFGDTLQFIRYAAPLAERGARVIAMVPEPLLRVIGGAAGVAEAVPMSAWPRYDRWAPLLDVPGLCGAPLSARVPYLRATGPSPVLPPGRRIGVAWAGDPRGVHDRQRSLAVEALAPLREIAGVVWISLQSGLKAPGWMHDPMPQVRDFADTAAVIASLDAVVSVDTAVAHLAGALGRPVLLLDRYDACWRWLTGRTDTDWYPTLRIVRQRAPGDWEGVVRQAVDLLRAPASPG